MSEQNDSANDRLEGLLRRWGAEEARAGVEPPAPPALPAKRPPGRPLRGVLLRWVPPAAAAAMLIAAAVLFFASGARQAKHQGVSPVAMQPARAPTRPAAEQVEALQAELARVREALREARGRLEAAAPKAAQEAALRQTADELDAEKRAMIAEMSGRIAGLNRALEQRAAELERMKHALAGISGKLTAARAEADEARKQAEAARRGRDAGDDEVARLRRMHGEALAAARDARRELAALKTKHEALLGDLQRLYLAAAAGGEVDLAARQAAARRARLAARCAEVRAAARTPSSRRVLEQLEVAFTRLDLLDAADAAEASAFASLVRGGALASRIDGLLAAADEPPQVRSLLLEAKLILWGADRVG
jgi:hypothetical protein